MNGEVLTGLTSRQAQILERLVQEYIDSGQPVSSEALVHRGRFDVSPATIRNEFMDLTERGYLAKPYASAGRVPTARAYRLFIEQRQTTWASPGGLAGAFEYMFADGDTDDDFRAIIKKMQAALDILGEVTQTLTAAIVSETYLQTSIEYVMREPEFSSVASLREFIGAAVEVRQLLDTEHPAFASPGDVLVLVGRELPMRIPQDLGLVVGAWSRIAPHADSDMPLSEKMTSGLTPALDGVIWALGPMRMHYEKTVPAVQDFIKLLNATV